MRFKDMETLLGQETITHIQGAIASALHASNGDHDTVCALREFLVGMLASIVTTKTYLPQSQQLAAEDAAQLYALVRKIKEIAPHQPATSAPTAAAMLRLPGTGMHQPPLQPFGASAAEPSGSAVQLARRRAHEPASATELGTVIPFPHAVRRSRPAPETETATEGEIMSHVASLSAARSAIARKKELTAQKREVLARSHALLAKSRSLRTSLEAVQLGCHF